ncbi:hypothetical protein SIM28_000948 [Salmonella enterica]|nr:hypothetical protein [Salmonella enterica]ELW8707864.1 hypothetical protein [Salmonella enterica]
MAKDRLLAEMAKGITPTNQLNGPQNRAEFHAGMYIPRHMPELLRSTMIQNRAP